MKRPSSTGGPFAATAQRCGHAGTGVVAAARGDRAAVASRAVQAATPDRSAVSGESVPRLERAWACPRDVLQRFSEDPDPAVNIAAARGLLHPPRWRRRQTAAGQFPKMDPVNVKQSAAAAARVAQLLRLDTRRSVLRLARSVPAAGSASIAAAAETECGTVVALLAAAGRGRCAATAREALQKGGSVADAALTHPALGPAAARAATDLLSRRQRDTAGGVGAWTARTVLSAGAPRRSLVSVAADNATDAAAREHAMSNLSCPPAVLVRLADDSDWDVAAAATSNPACMVNMIEKILTSRDWWDDPRSSAAANPACPPRVLRHVAADRDSYAWMTAVSNPACPEDILGDLAVSGEEPLRKTAAASAACPPQVLQHLIGDVNTDVRCAAVANPVCPTLELQRAALGQDPRLRAAAASNPTCPQWIVDELALSADPLTRAGVAANRACVPETLAVLAADDLLTVRVVAVRNPDCPSAALAARSADNETHVRACVAANPACPPETLAVLARDDEPTVRNAVAHNPACSPRLLATLAEDTDLLVSSGARWALSVAAAHQQPSS